MPKLKPTEEQEKGCVLRAYIAKNMELQRMDDAAVAVKLHVSRRTFQNKKRFPGTFRADELWNLCRVLKFTEEEKAAIL